MPSIADSYYSAESSHTFGGRSSNLEPATNGYDNVSMKDALHRDADESYWSRNHWFGQMLFNYLLGEPLSRGAGSGKDSAALDADRTAAIADFQLGDCLNRLTLLPEYSRLPDGPSRRAGVSYAKLMETVGALALHGDSSTMASLAAIIREHRPNAYSGAYRFSGLPPRAMAESSPPLSDGSKPDTIRGGPISNPYLNGRTFGRETIRHDEPHMGAYATRLKEYCDKSGHPLPEPEATQEPPTPQSQWTVSIPVNGVTFVGVARTKKEARYRAMRDACIEFGI